MKRAILWALAAAGAFLLFACTGISPDTQAAAMGAVNALYDAGQITMAKRDALLEVLERAAGGFTWEQVGTLGAGFVSTIIASLTGVQVIRGKAKPMSKEEGAILRELVAERVSAQATV